MSGPSSSGLLKRVYAGLIEKTGASEQFFRFYWYSRFTGWVASRSHGADRCSDYGTREQMFEALVRSEGLDGPIVYLEFGVYRGASIRWWAERNTHPGSVFTGFDSFSGLPEGWGDYPAGHFTTGGKPPETSDSRVSFQVGLFQDTWPRYLADHQWNGKTVYHMDADLWSSTLYVLTCALPRLKSGDILLFDEFCDYCNEFRAFIEFTMLSGMKYKVLASVQKFGKAAIRLL